MAIPIVKLILRKRVDHLDDGHLARKEMRGQKEHNTENPSVIALMVLQRRCCRSSPTTVASAWIFITKVAGSICYIPIVHGAAAPSDDVNVFFSMARSDADGGRDR